MILNPYSVVALFLCALRLLCAVAVLLVGTKLLRPETLHGDQQKRAEDRGYLAMALAALLLSLSLAAWPLLYLLLHSYIPQWPGVMCIYGVTQVGRGRHDFGRFLPTIIEVIEWLRPAIVFAVGAWLLVYRQARRGGQGVVSGKVAGALLLVAVLSGIDAGLELSYLLTPKQVAQASGGCCSLSQTANRGVSGYFTDHVDSAPSWLWGSEIAIIGILIIGSAALLLSRSGALSTAGMILLCAATIAGLVLSTIFLVDVAAPWLLRLPYHHCVYCLFTEIPESLLAWLALLGGGFCSLWAGVVSLTRGGGQGGSAARPALTRLLGCGFVGCLSFLVMLSLEMALAR